MENYLELLRKNPYYLNDEEIDWVKDMLKTMSLDAKIGQLFCGAVRAGQNEMIEKIIKKYQMGAVMLLPMSLDDTYDLVERIQNDSKIPLLIAANMEEGADSIEGGTNIGNNLEIAATGEVDMARKMAESIGAEASSAGVNWIFAPVVDLGMNWRNPVIATRVFGADPEFVRQAGRVFTDTVQQRDVAVALKHFPGDGVDERDQHFSPTINSLSCEEWDNTYGQIYRTAIDAGAFSVMAGHIMQPAWEQRLNNAKSEEDFLPASLSKELLNGLLRNHLGFNGMISTDSTTMTGFDQIIPRNTAVPMAIEAGCDMLLFSKNIDEDVDFVKKGIQSGILTMERVEEAVTRVLGLKAALKLHKKKNTKTLQMPKEKVKEIIGAEKYRTYERECADKAITLVKDKEHLFPISPEKHKRILLYGFASGRGFGSNEEELENYMKEKLETEGFSVFIHHPEPMCEGEMTSYRSVKNSYDLILYVANLTSDSSDTVCRLRWGISMGTDAPTHISDIPTVFISFGNPYHLVDVPRVKTYINAYKFKESTVEAVIQKMLGKGEFKGINPVDPFCGFPDAKW